MSDVQEVNEAQFDSDVLKSATPTVVDFWAPWCGPCRMVGPIVEELAAEYGGNVNFVKVNVDNNQGLAAKYKVQGIPTLLFVKDGEIVENHVGAIPKDALAAKVKTSLKVDLPS